MTAPINIGLDIERSGSRWVATYQSQRITRPYITPGAALDAAIDWALDRGYHLVPLLSARFSTTPEPS